jgi:hypothetical protein
VSEHVGEIEREGREGIARVELLAHVWIIR